MVDLIVSFFSVILKTNSSFHIDYIASLYNKFQICFFFKLSSPSVSVSGIADYLDSSTFLKNYLDSNYFIKSSKHFVIQLIINIFLRSSVLNIDISQIKTKLICMTLPYILQFNVK